MKHESRFGAHIGTSSLLLIFMTLALVSFGSLSLAGAQADERLSDKLAEHTVQYYSAAHEAEAFVAVTDAKLRAARSASTDEADYLARTAELASETVIPINDTQSLCVSLDFRYPDASDKDDRLYRIKKWRIEPIDDASYERHLPVSGAGTPGDPADSD
ncbi:MAG: hypothetical protein K5696_13370 [Lachnospiraceae bacterium]|nr:hypothetical protein [Lachnospiraceae bacterium]